MQCDIEVYLGSKFSEIAKSCGYSQHDSCWPPEEEVMTLLTRSDGLFIYAATAIRYIGAPGVNSVLCLTTIVRPGHASVWQASTIDSLYSMIMDQAFDKYFKTGGTRLGGPFPTPIVHGWHCFPVKHRDPSG